VVAGEVVITIVINGSMACACAGLGSGAEWKVQFAAEGEVEEGQWETEVGLVVGDLEQGFASMAL
jgi:hypothetical protein